MVMARLKPGASEKQAIAAATGPFLRSVMAVGQTDLLPVDLPQLVFVPASRGLETLRWGFSQPLWILTGVVGLVLLIACANIATLLLARAMARGREIGVRQALGASRWRLLRQLLTESVLLSILGGALGLLLAQWGGRALLLLMSGGDTVLNLGRPDLTVLGFCAGVSVLTGILFSLAPAIHAIRLNPAPTLKKAASGLGRLGSHLRLGKALVVVQVALGLLLLIGAGLFIRTLANLETQNLGFDRHNLLVFTIDPTKSGYEGPRIPRLCENVRERLHAVPGVQSVTYSQLALLTGWMNNGPISIEGYQAKLGQDMGTEWDPVGPDFFRTMGIRLILGRAIDRRDTGGSPRVAVINQAMARYFFGVKSPIGQRLSLDEKFNPANAAEIIGVVENAKYESLRADSRMIYFALNQSESALGKTFFEVRTAGSPLAAVSTIRAAIHDLDSSLALADLKTQNQIIAEQLGNERMMAELLSLFSLLALALAAIGLYGLMAYTVTQRTNEIGIRMALGAQRNQVLVLMLRQSILLVAVGVMVGLLAGIGAARLIASQLFGLKPTDPLTFAVAALSMFAVASVAAFIPARRATQVDPMVALRHE
jgi:predicted permease